MAPQSDRAILARLGLAVASLGLAAVLVLGFKAPEASPAGATSTSGDGTTSAGGSTSTGSGTGTPTATPGAVAGSTATETVTGSLIETYFGPVQVQVTIAKGRIQSVVAVQLPSGGRSGRIAAYAAPILSSEALAAQSANIDFVSGATYTSDGYTRSLQSALDQVHA